MFQYKQRVKMYFSWLVCFLLLGMLIIFSGKPVKAETEETTEPQPGEPTPTVAETPTEDPTPSPSIVIATDTPTVEPTPEDTPVPTPTPIPTLTPAPSPTETPLLTSTPTPTQSVSGTPTPTLSPTSTPYATIIPPDEDTQYWVKETDIKATVAGKPKLVIDGTAEAEWNRFVSVPLQNISWGKKGAAASFQLTWDSDYLYLLITVDDSTPDFDSEIFTRKDSVEIFLNENGEKPAAYAAGDQHYLISRNGEIKAGNGGDERTLRYAVCQTPTGYVLETAIPFQTIQAESGMSIGLDIRINDSQGKGKRDFILQWSDTSMNTHTDLSGIGTVILR